MYVDLSFDVEGEIVQITRFISEVYKKNGKKKLIVACSGGIDSSITLALAIKAVGSQNIHSISLPYKDLNKEGLSNLYVLVDSLSIQRSQVEIIKIDPIVNEFAKILGVSQDEKIRFGNILSRTRMIMLFDRAKKYDGLVCGTENRSEYLLGYFTRFGDEASDLEPIRHLYKTQVYALAKGLGLPSAIINQTPTAGLYKGQTDESQLGFGYEEADQVLALHFDKNKAFEEISSTRYPHKQAIWKRMKDNEFKHNVPYVYKKN